MQLFTAPPTMSLTETQFMALQATAGYTMLFKTSETQSVREIAQNTLNAIALLTKESDRVNGSINSSPHPESIRKRPFLSAPSRLANNEFSIEGLNIIEPADHFNIIKHAVQILNGTLTYQPLTAVLPRGTWATTIATGTAAEITTGFRNHLWNNFTSYSSPPYFLIVATETETLGDLVTRETYRSFTLPDASTETLLHPLRYRHGIYASGGDAHIEKERSFLHNVEVQIAEVYDYHRFKRLASPPQRPHFRFRFTT